MVIKGDFTEKSILAITQTFANQNGFYRLKPLSQLKRVAYYFQCLADSCDYQLNVELTKANVIHLHGLIAIRPEDRKLYHNKTFPLLKSYGHLLVKSIDNLDKWLAYCEKEQKEIKAVFPKCEFPITNDNFYQLYNIRKQKFKDIVEWASPDVIHDIMLEEILEQEAQDEYVEALAVAYHVAPDEPVD